MLFMLRIVFREDQQDPLLAYFDEHGLTRYEAGVELRGAWASREMRTVYVVAEAKDAAQFDTAIQDLDRFGELEFDRVTDVFQL